MRMHRKSNLEARLARCADVAPVMGVPDRNLKRLLENYRNYLDLPALFGGAQQGYFTHIWGFKQQMRDEAALYEDFCRRCAARLRRDFPDAAARIARVPALTRYFED